jgi:DNA-binding CsgD family transcriptional regulator
MKSLTKKESQVLNLVSLGYSSGQMAAALNISSNTVETHRRNLLSKFEAKNSADMVRKAAELGLLSADPDRQNETVPS